LYSRPADKSASGAWKRRNRTLLEGAEEEISCLRSMDSSEYVLSAWFDSHDVKRLMASFGVESYSDELGSVSS